MLGIKRVKGSEIAAELAEGKRYLVSYDGHLFLLVDDKHIYRLKEASAFDFIETQIGGFNKVAMTYCSQEYSPIRA